MTIRRYRSAGSKISMLALACGALEFSVVRIAHAEDDSATEIAAARSLAIDGLKLAQSGKCEEAIPKLDHSEKLHHSAIVLERLGECQIAQGKLVEGTEMLRKVLREPLPQNPTPALSKAYEHAQTALDAARPHIASLTISLGETPVPELRLTVDGQTVSETLVDTALPADPGEHLIEASAPGYLKATANVTLAAADKKTVSLKLDKDPNAPVVVAPAPGSEPKSSAPPTERVAPSAPPPAAPPAARPEPSRAAAYVAWSAGLVGAGVGATFGLIALKDKHNLDPSCGSNVCTPSSSGSLDSAKRAGNISTIGFSVAGAGLVLGTVLYFAIGSGTEESHASGTRSTFAGLSHGRALVGPGSLELAADF